MRSPRVSRFVLSLVALLACACSERLEGEPALVRDQRSSLRLRERVPNTAESATVGPAARPRVRGSRAFSELIRCEDPRIVFKDEEKTAADRMMTPRLRSRLSVLALLVERRWPKVKLRVTEAWDEDREHGESSVHYEGRAADVTTSDQQSDKLGYLARMAIDAEFDWVFYEDASHVHVSVKR